MDLLTKLENGGITSTADFLLPHEKTLIKEQPLWIFIAGPTLNSTHQLLLLVENIRSFDGKQVENSTYNRVFRPRIIHVGGPSGDFPIGPPIPIMKRFTSSVCFNFLLLLLKVSFSLFVCSRQLVLKIWKVSDLYLYQVVQHKSLIYLATSTFQINVVHFFTMELNEPLLNIFGPTGQAKSPPYQQHSVYSDKNLTRLPTLSRSSKEFKPTTPSTSPI